jgi:hypothetical protein
MKAKTSRELYEQWFRKWYGNTQNPHEIYWRNVRNAWQAGYRAGRKAK